MNKNKITEEYILNNKTLISLLAQTENLFKDCKTEEEVKELYDILRHKTSFMSYKWRGYNRETTEKIMEFSLYREKEKALEKLNSYENR